MLTKRKAALRKLTIYEQLENSLRLAKSNNLPIPPQLEQRINEIYILYRETIIRITAIKAAFDAQVNLARSNVLSYLAKDPIDYTSLSQCILNHEKIFRQYYFTFENMHSIAEILGVERSSYFLKEIKKLIREHRHNVSLNIQEDDKVIKEKLNKMLFSSGSLESLFSSLDYTSVYYYGGILISQLTEPFLCRIEQSLKILDLTKDNLKKIDEAINHAKENFLMLIDKMHYIKKFSQESSVITESWKYADFIKEINIKLFRSEKKLVHILSQQIDEWKCKILARKFIFQGDESIVNECNSLLEALSAFNILLTDKNQNEEQLLKIVWQLIKYFLDTAKTNHWLVEPCKQMESSNNYKINLDALYLYFQQTIRDKYFENHSKYEVRKFHSAESSFSLRESLTPSQYEQINSLFHIRLALFIYNSNEDRNWFSNNFNNECLKMAKEIKSIISANSFLVASFSNKEWNAFVKHTVKQSFYLNKLDHVFHGFIPVNTIIKTKALRKSKKTLSRIEEINTLVSMRNKISINVVTQERLKYLLSSIGVNLSERNFNLLINRVSSLANAPGFERLASITVQELSACRSSFSRSSSTLFSPSSEEEKHPDSRSITPTPPKTVGA